MEIHQDITSRGFLVSRTQLTGVPDWKPWDPSYSHSLLTSADFAALASCSVPPNTPHSVVSCCCTSNQPTQPLLSVHTAWQWREQLQTEQACHICATNTKIIHITHTNTYESLIKFILYSDEKLFFPLRTAASSKKQCVEKRNSRSPTWVWTRGKLRRWYVSQDLYHVWPRADVWKNVTFKNIYIQIKALFRCITV